MKLIIDIHEEQYEFIKQGMPIDKVIQFPALMEAVCEHITNGIPLDENKGEWIKVHSGDKDFPESIVCSKCGNENSHFDFNEHAEPIGKVFITSKFCPNCGADMRGKAE